VHDAVRDGLEPGGGRLQRGDRSALFVVLDGRELEARRAGVDD
jgi:hypothetical protein